MNSVPKRWRRSAAYNLATLPLAKTNVLAAKLEALMVLITTTGM
jgi:hypothetical protein